MPFGPPQRSRPRRGTAGALVWDFGGRPAVWPKFPRPWVRRNYSEFAGAPRRRVAWFEAPPPFVSDGHGGIDEALITVYGKVPAYSGWGRPPRKKQAVDGWQYMQLVKQRDAYRRVTGLAAKVMHGTAAQVKKTVADASILWRAHPSDDARV